MKILLDTNILVHAHNKSSPHREEASNIIRRAIRGEFNACLTSQVLYEFFAVITNPKRVEKPLTTDDAADVCKDFLDCQEIEKMNPTLLVTSQVFQFARELKLSRSKVFDCVLAITAKENGIDVIYTENVDDFKNYGFLNLLIL